MHGIGLVLAGGGGKGAYQIGVWKYLREQGLDRYVRGVSGTSVGGLNAALFAAGDYETAEELWLNISPEYALSQEGLCELMDRGLNFDALRNSHILCYVTCLRTPDFMPERFNLRNYSTDEIRSILLATSAIPFIYEPVEIQEKLYIDGGVRLAGGDNIPIQPLYDMGLEYIFVLHLSRDEAIDKPIYPGAKIIEIVPQENLGGLISGMLDFSPQGAKRRLNQGYEDAKRNIEPFVNQLCIAAQQEHELNEAGRRQQKFESSYHYNHETLKAIRQKQASDDFDQLIDKLSGKG